MAKTLRQTYEEKKQRRLQERRDVVLTEAFIDLFKSGSSNIQKFNTTIAGLKSIAAQYKMQNLTAAIQNAEQQFETVVANQATGDKAAAGDPSKKSQVLSMATTFVGVMSDFMKSVSKITAQLPTMKNAMAQGADPAKAQQPMRDLLGQDSGKFAGLINAQFEKGGQGVLATIGRFLKGGPSQASATKALQFFGLDAGKVTQDLTNMTAQQFSEFVKSSPNAPAFQLDASAAPPAAAPGSNPGTAPAAGQAAAPAAGTAAPAPAAQAQSGQPTAAPTTQGIEKDYNAVLKHIGANALTAAQVQALRAALDKIKPAAPVTPPATPAAAPAATPAAA